MEQIEWADDEVQDWQKDQLTQYQPSHHLQCATEWVRFTGAMKVCVRAREPIDTEKSAAVAALDW
jgi:hypothetical protein